MNKVKTKARSHKIGIVIVAYGNPHDISRLVKQISKQKKPGDELVVVDNHHDHESASIARNDESVDVVVEADNRGFFAGGCNRGVSELSSSIDTILLLNPDTSIAEDLLEEMRMVDHATHDAWMPLLLLEDGTVNSSGNSMHMSGLSWCNGYLDSKDLHKSEKTISVISGACFAVTRKLWNRVGGMSEGYGLYYEDTDMSTRLLLSGAQLSLVPSGEVTHLYDYEKGDHKWLYIERNRLLYIIRTWPAPVIAVLLPQLIVVEFGLWFVALLQRRLFLKVRSTVMLIKALPWAIKTRPAVQRTKSVTAAYFFENVSHELNTPLFGFIGRSKLINYCTKAYYQLALAILRVFSSQRSNSLE